MAASWLKTLLEPERLQVADNTHALAFALAGAVTVAGAVVVIVLIRRLGKVGPGISRGEALLGYPLGLAAFILPAVFIAALHGRQPYGNPLMNGITQATIALMCIVALANHPWRQAHEERGSWFRVNPRQLMWMPLLWLVAYIPMQLAMFASVQLHQWLRAPVVQQDVVKRLVDSHGAGAMFGWFLMAVVAAPLMEEFVFRVVLFGATRKLLDGISTAPGWKHPANWIALAFSVTVFVLAHGVWGWTVGIIPLTLLSLILTLIYAHSKSIWNSMLYHAMHNAFVVLTQYFVLR